MNFSEALKYYTAGLLNLDKVLEARWNDYKKQKGTLAPDVEAEADRRFKICEGCPFMSVNAKTSPEYKALYGKHYQTSRLDSDPHCSICACDIPYKVLSMESMCGLSVWNNEHPELYIEPKWLAYTPK